jgi:hypothetical protein
LAVLILNPVQAHVEWRKNEEEKKNYYVEEESIIEKPKMELEE